MNAARTTATVLLGLLATTGLASWPATFHRGVCIEGGPLLEEKYVVELKELGVTHVSLNPFAWMRAPDDPRVELREGEKEDPSARFWGESDEGLLQYSRMAQAHGLCVMLRPHIWLSRTTDSRGRSGLWLGDVGFAKPEDWQTFFTRYRRFCLHYARLAESAGIDWYSIGAELTRATLEHPEQWRSLIAEVRQVYHGKLVYSANWWKEAEGIQFWGDLDAIGVQAYFPVATGPASTEQEMLVAWRRQLAGLRRVSTTVGRPILFTEIGYRAVAETAVRPWEWSGGGPPSPEAQARAYRVAFQAVAEAPEISGLYWWKFHVASPRESGPGSSSNRLSGYTWQGKPAESVLRTAYTEGR